MRISPIFIQSDHSGLNAMGQTFQRTNCRKQYDTGKTGFYSSGDVFLRLAEASMRDADIESELKSMELI